MSSAEEPMEVATAAAETESETKTEEPEPRTIVIVANPTDDNVINNTEIKNIQDNNQLTVENEPNSETPVDEISTNYREEESAVVLEKVIDDSRESLTDNCSVNVDDANIEQENIDNEPQLCARSANSPETSEKPKFFYDWINPLRLLCSASEEYKSSESNENFTKGCQWSPDGTCLLVPAEDFRIRIYELPRELYSGKVPSELPLENFKPALSIREGGLVYDSCWYPLMNSWDPATCCFLSTSRESPLHLWDAFNGELRATYRPYNQVDEVEAAISVQFIDDGREVWCGFKGALRSFDTERPGRQKETISFKTDFPNVNGLVSCIRENPMMRGLIAFGTYSKCVGLWKDGPLCSLKTDSGVTQVEFSPCGTKLYTAVRRSNDFLCWDLRNPGVVLYSLQNRQANTNQRIQFALSNDGSEIVSGGTDGFVNIWKIPDVAKDEEEISPVSRIRISNDCINGVNMHRTLPILATSSGQRICDHDEEMSRDNSVKLWFCQNEE